MLEICSIASGSNGNCYYVGNTKEAVLIDAGISCREIERRMQRKNLDIRKVKALFISHEHSDHIAGMRTLSKKYQLPVFITHSTLKSTYSKIEKHLIYSFHEAQDVQIGELKVKPFRKCHDAADPHSFIVSANGLNVGVFTDIGHACDSVQHHFSQCHAAFLESNYCEEMLMNGDYPLYLKRRISGKNGHLSNMQALELFVGDRNDRMSHLILSHLSKNNNSPEKAWSVFHEYADNIELIVSSRYEESMVFNLDASAPLFTTKPDLQLSLFPL